MEQTKLPKQWKPPVSKKATTPKKKVVCPITVKYKTIVRHVLLVGIANPLHLRIGYALKNNDGMSYDDEHGERIATGRAMKDKARLNKSIDVGFLFKEFGCPKSIIKAYLEVQALRIQRDPLKYFPVLENEYKRELKAKQHETKDSK